MCVHIDMRLQGRGGGKRKKQNKTFSVQLERTLNVCSCVLLKNGGSVHCLRDPQVWNSTKKTFKTGSHETIHTFKNYFATVFLIFSNKQYSNRSLRMTKRLKKTLISLAPIYTPLTNKIIYIINK